MLYVAIVRGLDAIVDALNYCKTIICAFSYCTHQRGVRAMTSVGHSDAHIGNSRAVTCCSGNGGGGGDGGGVLQTTPR